MKNSFLQVQPGEAFKFTGKFESRYRGLVFAQVDLQRSLRRLQNAGQPRTYRQDPSYQAFPPGEELLNSEVEIMGTVAQAL